MAKRLTVIPRYRHVIGWRIAAILDGITNALFTCRKKQGKEEGWNGED
jgi:hypothetical protein